MFHEAIEWNDTADKEALLDYVIDYQYMIKMNQVLLDQHGAEELFLGLTPRELFVHDMEHVERRKQRLDGISIVINKLYDDQGRINGQFGVQWKITDQHKVQLFLKVKRKSIKLLRHW